MAQRRELNPERLREIYRLLVLSRRMDERALSLLRQGKAFFHIGSSGHEAPQVAISQHFSPGEDWAFPYYRDLPFVLGWGMTPKEVYLHTLGKQDDPNSGGRQMPSHWGHKKTNMFTQSSPTGTQYLHAVGAAQAMKLRGEPGKVYVSSGEGTTSQGDFYEAVNLANREKLPVLFHVENNRWAISVPYDKQAAGVPASQMLEGYSNLFKVHITEGTDLFAAYELIADAVEHIESGKGPALVLSEVVRLLPHSSSDDQRKYRKKEELESDSLLDPIELFEKKCEADGCIPKEEAEAIRKEVVALVEESEKWALAQPDPDPATALDHNFVSLHSETKETEPGTDGEDIVMVDAINHALAEEMERDPRVILFGEDVEDKKGGVFGASRGLSDQFGPKRVFNSPLAESSIIGSAIGLAANGMKPVAEIQFVDFLWPGFNQLKSELATIHYRSNGQWMAPVIIRTPVGGYIHGGLYHSQSQDAIFAHIPGLKVAYPSNAADAKGLLKEAIRGDDPVLFLEHKALYRQRSAARPEPNSDWTLPFGKGKVVQKGDDVTLVAWGMQLQKALQAVRLLQAGGAVEVIDPRTLVPFDWELVYESVRKTGKLLIAHEDHLTGGFGGEIAARVFENCFESLDGPVKRVAGADSHIPYAPSLEKEVLPQVENIAEALKELLEY